MEIIERIRITKSPSVSLALYAAMQQTKTKPLIPKMLMISNPTLSTKPIVVYIFSRTTLTVEVAFEIKLEETDTVEIMMHPIRVDSNVVLYLEWHAAIYYEYAGGEYVGKVRSTIAVIEYILVSSFRKSRSSPPAKKNES